VDERTGLPVVTMIGGGQLARMTHQAAIALGQSLRVLSATTVTSTRCAARPPARRR
jgi:phosphoribosylaminoimidazole carboxylase (NCAIR synthetase)